MKNGLGLLTLLILASAASASELADAATLEKTISDSFFETNGIFLSMTNDGTDYWSLSGGFNVSTVTRYDPDGNVLERWDITQDGRTIAYNPENGRIYVKDYITNSLYALDCGTDTGFTYELVPGFGNRFQYNQSKIAFSPDGLYLYDHYKGTVRKYELATGNIMETITLDPEFTFSLDHPENYQIGTDGERLFFIHEGMVKAYAMNGTHIKDITGMPTGFLAIWSFSGTDNLIWTYNDDTLVWEGYGIYAIPPEPAGHAQLQICTQTNAPMFPAAGLPIGIMAATLAGAYGIARKQ